MRCKPMERQKLICFRLSVANMKIFIICIFGRAAKVNKQKTKEAAYCMFVVHVYVL